MAEAKHTGPWSVTSDKDWRQHSCCYGFAIVAFRDGEKVTVAETLEESDARLIAAAPGMLEALEAAVAPECVGHATAAQCFFRDNERSRAAIAKIRAAIAKATGEQ